MYEYRFVKVNLGWGFTARPKEDYQRLIQEHADEGWRLVQIFAPAVTGYGKAAFYELIFEREKKAS